MLSTGEWRGERIGRRLREKSTHWPRFSDAFYERAVSGGGLAEEGRSKWITLRGELPHTCGTTLSVQGVYGEENYDESCSTICPLCLYKGVILIISISRGEPHMWSLTLSLSCHNSHGSGCLTIMSLLSLVSSFYSSSSSSSSFKV